MSHKPFTTDSGVYTVPLTGMYQVKAQLWHLVPTGKYISKRNPDKRWYEFWKPEMVEQMEYETVKNFKGSELRFFKAGESISMELCPTSPDGRGIK